MVIQSVEDMGCGRIGDQSSWSLVVVIGMSGRKHGLVVVIPNIDSGGCMEMGGIRGLGQVVGTNIGIRRGCQRQGHQGSCMHRLGLI